MTLRLDDVRVTFGGTTAVDGVTFELDEGERLAILGPSGSGKSTLLRAIAGLEPIAGGHIAWAGSDLAAVPVHRRGFGLMFQDYALFPHRDVYGNVAFGLETHGMPAAQRKTRIDEVLTLVGLPGYGSRRIDQLSGGEQQRVALARALAPTPLVLMLDEPLGALDRSLRTRLLDDLAGLFKTLGLPIIYVTHDQEEALAVGHRVAVLNRGRLEALMPARELWQSPSNDFVARFLGLTNIVPLATARDHLVTPWGEVQWSGSIPRSGVTQLLIRPEALALSPDGPLAGVVSAVTFHGESTTIFVRPTDSAHGPTLEAHLNSATTYIPEVGAEVTLSVDPSGVLFLP